VSKYLSAPQDKAKQVTCLRWICFQFLWKD